MYSDIMSADIYARSAVAQGDHPARHAEVGRAVGAERQAGVVVVEAEAVARVDLEGGRAGARVDRRPEVRLAERRASGRACRCRSGRCAWTASAPRWAPARSVRPDLAAAPAVALHVDPREAGRGERAGVRAERVLVAVVVLHVQRAAVGDQRVLGGARARVEDRRPGRRPAAARASALRPCGTRRRSSGRRCR